MAKYEMLGTFLGQQTTSEIPMTFAEIERVIGHPLPRSSRYPAWWSNNPSNNVMTKIWLKAGFKTEQVSIESRKLVFRRVTSPSAATSKPADPRRRPGMADVARGYAVEGKTAPHNREENRAVHPAFGSMKGMMVIAPGVDLTEPAADSKSWKLRW